MKPTATDLLSSDALVKVTVRVPREWQWTITELTDPLTQTESDVMRAALQIGLKKLVKRRRRGK